MLLTYQAWLKRGCPRIKIKIEGGHFATLYTQAPGDESTACVQTNVDLEGFDFEPRTRMYKGDRATEIWGELGLFASASTEKKAPAAKPTGKKKVRPEPDPFEDLHST